MVLSWILEMLINHSKLACLQSCREILSSRFYKIRKGWIKISIATLWTGCTLLSKSTKIVHNFWHISSIGKNRKVQILYPVDILIRIRLTLSISMVTNMQAFSTTNFVSKILWNKVENDFVIDYLVIYVEKEIVQYRYDNPIIFI